MKIRPLCTQFLVLIIIALSFTAEAWCGEPMISTGQTVYVPVYSHVALRFAPSIGWGSSKDKSKEVPFQLATNASVRNTDPRHSITIMKADYYNTEGSIVKKYVETPVVVAPMATTYFFVSQSDESGGVGANFLIRWESQQPVNEPIIESVTFGSRGTHSLSFVTKGKPIRE